MKNWIKEELTPTEYAIAELVHKELTNRQIAETFISKHTGKLISESTVQTHIKSISGKLGVSGRKELANLPDWHFFYPKQDIPDPDVDIAGHWVSIFVYKDFNKITKQWKTEYQLDFEWLWQKNGSYLGTSINTSSKQHYEHEFNLQVYGNTVGGWWFNTDGSPYRGVVLLLASSSGNSLCGQHLGFSTSLHDVTEGRWIWVKLDEKNVSNNKLKHWDLKSIDIPKAFDFLSDKMHSDHMITLDELCSIK